MAHGDAREGKWRGNGEWSGYPVLFTLPRNMVYPALLSLTRTPRLPVVDWTEAPRRIKWTRPLRRKTKSSFCACAITFQLASTNKLLLSTKREQQLHVQAIIHTIFRSIIIHYETHTALALSTLWKTILCGHSYYAQADDIPLDLTPQQSGI